MSLAKIKHPDSFLWIVSGHRSPCFLQFSELFNAQCFEKHSCLLWEWIIQVLTHLYDEKK